MFRAWISDLFLGTQKVFVLLELSRDDSKISGSAISASDVRSSTNPRAHAHMMEFLNRVMRMGIWLLIMLLLSVLSSVTSIIPSKYLDSSPTFRVTPLLQAISYAFFASASYQILWFLNFSYLRTYRNQILNNQVASKVPSHTIPYQQPQAVGVVLSTPNHSARSSGKDEVDSHH